MSPTTPIKPRQRRIADPVHGYIDFTVIERAILDHRVAQRLRNIAQSGLNHLVFPEVRSSRFSHSLGAMHLASRFLAYSIRNADDPTRSALISALVEVVQIEAGAVSSVNKAAEDLRKEPALLAYHYCPPEYHDQLLLIEQAVRLAALFHDLGHLPFSHDFENALDDLWHEMIPAEQISSQLRSLLQQQGGETKLHERLGHRVAQLLLRALFSSEGDTQNETARISFQLAMKILTSSSQPDALPVAAAVYWLHTLVDSEVDSDRCDYILRDGRNYGFEFATYDLSRLLDNLVVVRKQQAFELAIQVPGLSAIETFLLARFRSYEYGIFHHKVAQISAALRYSTVQILRSGASTDPYLQFITDLARIIGGIDLDDSQQQELLSRFASYDDIWWMSHLRHQCEEQPTEWLNLICWRHSGPISLWKRASDVPTPDLRAWNVALSDPNNDEAANKWQDEVSKLGREGVLVVRHFFKPWKENDSGHSRLQAQERDGTLVSITKRLPLVYNLREVWLQSTQVNAFTTSTSTYANRAIDVFGQLPVTSLESGASI